jgi:hypothetical protein
MTLKLVSSAGCGQILGVHMGLRNMRLIKIIFTVYIREVTASVV